MIHMYYPLELKDLDIHLNIHLDREFLGIHNLCIWSQLVHKFYKKNRMDHICELQNFQCKVPQYMQANSLFQEENSDLHNFGTGFHQYKSHMDFYMLNKLRDQH